MSLDTNIVLTWKGPYSKRQGDCILKCMNCGKKTWIMTNQPVEHQEKFIKGTQGFWRCSTCRELYTEWLFCLKNPSH